jgi:tetratricopeptide (TPR) repeat protein
MDKICVLVLCALADSGSMQFPNSHTANKLRSGNAETFYKRGKDYASHGEFEQAIQNFTQAIRTKLDYADAFKERSEAHMYMHDSKSVLLDINRVIELLPSDADTLSSRGTIHYQNRGLFGTHAGKSPRTEKHCP